MKIAQLKPAVIVQEPLFPEPVQVITTLKIGESVKLVGKGHTDTDAEPQKRGWIRVQRPTERGRCRTP
jgi:hypothetical protein